MLIPVRLLGMELLQTPSSHQGFNSIIAFGATLLTTSLGHCVSARYAFHAAARTPLYYTTTEGKGIDMLSDTGWIKVPIDVKLTRAGWGDCLRLPAGTKISSYKNQMVVAKPGQKPQWVLIGENCFALKPLS